MMATVWQSVAPSIAPSIAADAVEEFRQKQLRIEEYPSNAPLFRLPISSCPKAQRTVDYWLKVPRRFIS